MKKQEQTKKALKIEENLRKVANEFLQEKGNEIKKLNFIIKEAVLEHEYARKEHEEIISERDILGTQLIRRNDELALLYEKIKIQQRTLQQGEIAYKQRLEESRALMIKTAALKRELYLGNQQVANIGDLKKELWDLQRELLQERTKVK